MNQSYHVILLNMGGPNSLDDVPKFLYQLFADKELIDFPFPINLFQKPLAKAISFFRSKGTKDMYRLIGGGSPIERLTRSFANNLEAELRQKGIDAKVSMCMRYSSPRSFELVNGIECQEQIILFSQYPHYAASTSGSSFNDFYHAYNSKCKEKQPLEIRDWSTEPFYIDWWVREIRRKINVLRNKGISRDIHVICSAHGLPLRYIRKGEKYPERVNAAFSQIKSQFNETDEELTFHLSYQSRAGPFPWLQPYTDKLIERLAEKNPAALVLVPLGFVTDHVETLYEIDILYRELAKELGMQEFHRVAVPNDDKQYAEGAAEMIERLLKTEVSNN